MNLADDLSILIVFLFFFFIDFIHMSLRLAILCPEYLNLPSQISLNILAYFGCAKLHEGIHHLLVTVNWKGTW